MPRYERNAAKGVEFVDVRIDGVSDVILFGQRDYSMRIWVDPDRLAARSLNAPDVATAYKTAFEPEKDVKDEPLDLKKSYTKVVLPPPNQAGAEKPDSGAMNLTSTWTACPGSGFS